MEPPASLPTDRQHPVACVEQLERLESRLAPSCCQNAKRVAHPLVAVEDDTCVIESVRWDDYLDIGVELAQDRSGVAGSVQGVVAPTYSLNVIARQAPPTGKRT